MAVAPLYGVMRLVYIELMQSPKVRLDSSYLRCQLRFQIIITVEVRKREKVLVKRPGTARLKIMRFEAHADNDFVVTARRFGVSSPKNAHTRLNQRRYSRLLEERLSWHGEFQKIRLLKRRWCKFWSGLSFHTITAAAILLVAIKRARCIKTDNQRRPTQK